MRFVNLKKVKSSFIGFLISLFLCLSFFIASFDRDLAAAQSEEDRAAKLVEGAKKEGEFLLYSTMLVDQADKFLKKFQEKYPFIKTGVYRSNGDALLSKIVAEDQAKRYLCDVASIEAMSMEVLKRKNLLAKYLSPQGKFFPEVFKDPEGYWIATYYLLNALAYNTKLVAPKDVPKTYEDLLDPKWKGKITMDANPFYWFGSMLKIMGEEKGLQYMKKLSEQGIKFRQGRTLNIQMVAAGEISINLPAFSHTVDTMKAQGAPIEWTTFGPLIAEVHSPSISAHAPHPNAAALFIDFMLSREAQEIMASFYKLPTREDVEARSPRAKAKGQKILPFDPSISDNYEKYTKLFRGVLMKRQAR